MKKGYRHFSRNSSKQGECGSGHVASVGQPAAQFNVASTFKLQELAFANCYIPTSPDLQNVQGAGDANGVLRTVCCEWCAANGVLRWYLQNVQGAANGVLRMCAAMACRDGVLRWHFHVRIDLCRCGRRCCGSPCSAAAASPSMNSLSPIMSSVTIARRRCPRVLSVVLTLCYWGVSG